MVKTSILSPLTLSRILFSALAIVALGVVVNAQTVVRTNGETQTATGTDVSTVQTADNYASGDVITVSGTSETSIAPFTSEVRVEGSATNPYNVIDFTVQSATGDKQYIGGLSNNRNYTLKLSNKKYNLTFKNVEFQNNDIAQKTSGIFINMDQNSSTLTLNLDNASFTKYKGNTDTNNIYGGVIYSNGDLKINGSNVVSFHGNSARSGGAIFGGGKVTIDCNEIIFDSNSTYNSGVIRNNGALDIQGSKVTFSNNSAKFKGGSIYSSSTIKMTGKGDNPIFTFSNNKATDQGGVIYSEGAGITIDCNKIEISNNKASAGGAIALEKSDTSVKTYITGKTVTFNNNSTTNGNGGAIHTLASVKMEGKTNDSVFTFRNNSSQGNAGVMVVVGTVDISTGTFKFEKNSANGTTSTTGFAGAIEARKGITFHGDGTSATFTDNITYSGKGNDIYLTNDSVLTFKDSGTYYFDGGIYLVNTGASTDINKAQVTIAGRQYKPVIKENDPENVEDTTNNYQLQTVKISNDGKLTANLDYINSLTGKFNLGTSTTAGTLELNVSGEEPVLLTMSDTLTITGANNGKVVKNGDGTLKVYADAEHMVDVSKLVVSSGRMDIMGYFKGSLVVGEDLDNGKYSTATFSPGNSVGKLEVNGNFTLNPGSTLLMEIGSTDAEGNDQLIVNDGGSILFQDNSIIEFVPTSSLTLSPNQVFEVTMPDVDIDNVTFTSYYFTLQGYDGRNVILGVDPNAVPEPSTWALLILGAAGLLYWRKRK